MNVRLLPRGRTILEPDFLDPSGVRSYYVTAGLVDVDAYPQLRKHTVHHLKCGICQRMNGRHRNTCAYRPDRSPQ